MRESDEDPGGEVDDVTLVYRRRFDADRPRAMSLAVVEAIESIAGEETIDARSLYDVVDPDALDALFAPRTNGLPRTRGSVTLPLVDHELRVHADGLVEVYARGIDGGSSSE